MSAKSKRPKLRLENGGKEAPASGVPFLPRDDDEPRSKRGVVELQTDCGCWRKFLIRDSSGASIRVVQIPTVTCSDDDIEDLWVWLDENDPPQPTLRVVR